MTILDKKLELIVHFLGFRRPVTEIAKITKYSKGAVSNYLTGRQDVSKRFMDILIDHTNKEFNSFEFKTRLLNAFKQYLQVNNMSFESFLNLTGLKELRTENESVDQFIHKLNESQIEHILNRISFSIDSFLIQGNAIENNSTIEMEAGFQSEIASKLVNTIKENKNVLMNDQAFRKTLAALLYPNTKINGFQEIEAENEIKY